MTVIPITIEPVTTNKDLTSIKNLLKKYKDYNFIIPKINALVSTVNKNNWIIVIKQITDLGEYNIVSFVNLVKQDDNLIINFCYTDPSQRRLGYMNQLFEYAEQLALTNNCKFIKAIAFENSHSIKLFEKLNYKMFDVIYVKKL